MSYALHMCVAFFAQSKTARYEEIINGSGRKIAKMESRSIAVFSFSLIEVTTPYMKKRNNVIPIRVLRLKTVSM